MMDQPFLFIVDADEPDEPIAHARRSDPQTSRDAAASVDHIRKSQRIIYHEFQRLGPMTDSALILCLRSNGLIKISDSGARTRRSELVTLGLVEDSGERRQLPSGRWSIVWRAV